MKKTLLGFLLTGCILITFSSVGQSATCPIKKVNGIDYYLYSVQASEGLLSISRKFNIPMDEIQKANPELISGLQAGQEVLIPVRSTTVSTTQGTTSAECIKHVVEKKQTLFAISRKYNVSKASIEKYNPDLKNGLKEGMVLNIPVKPTSNTTEVNTNQNLIIHKVLPKETLFSISKRYDVDIKEIERLNPHAAKKIVAGSELNIPVKDKLTPPEGTGNPQPTNKVIPVQENTAKKRINIAFMLPFMLEQAKKESALERFQHFYSGALLAILEAKERGISFEIYTYDTDKTEERITSVLTGNPELKTMDLIIGPAFTHQVASVAAFAKENKVNTLIPFSSKVADIGTNPYLFQFNPGSDTELKYLYGLMHGKLKDWHIVFAEMDGISAVDEGKIRTESLKKELTQLRKSSGSIKLSSPGNIDFTHALKKESKNLLIFNTDNYASVRSYLNSLLSIPSAYDLVLFEPYNWTSQPQKKPTTMYIAPFMSNVSGQSIIDFNMKLNQFFGKDLTGDSPRYDILGYDLTNYFIAYINTFGSAFATNIGALRSMEGIQSQPLFRRVSAKSGCINQQLYLGETTPY